MSHAARLARRRLTLWGVAALALVFAADQASKAWILDGLRLPELGRVDLLTG